MFRFNYKYLLDRLDGIIERYLGSKKRLAYVFIACLIIVGMAGLIRNPNRIVPANKTGSKAEEAEKIEPSDIGVETLSLRDVAGRSHIPQDRMMALFHEKKYKINSLDDTLEQIAKDNKTSPETLVRIIENASQQATAVTGSSFSQIRNLSLEELCDQKNLSLSEILSRVEAEGVKIDTKERIIDIANKPGMSRHKVVAIIQGNPQ